MLTRLPFRRSCTHLLARLLAVFLCLGTTGLSRAVEVPPPNASVDIERIVQSMTPEEKVGQLLMFGFAGTRLNRQIAFWLTGRRVGGVALFSRNIVDFEQTARFTRELHGATQDGIPIFLALDQE